MAEQARIARAAGRDGGPTTQTRSGRPGEERAPDTWVVVDDLPRPIPVGRAELAVLEMYLGAEIDLLLSALKP